MPSLLIFSTSDIGENYRLLHHAKSFSSLSNSRVTIFAPDVSSLPKEIEKSANINFVYLYIWHFSYLLDLISFPIQYLIIQFQCFLFYLKSHDTYDFVMSRPWPLFDSIFSLSLSRMFKSKLIFDISYFRFTDKKRALFIRKLEKKVNRIADYRICSTRAIQVFLKLLNLSSAIVHDPPGTQFHSDKVIKKEIYSFLDISERYLIAVLMPTYDIQYLNTILDNCSNLDKQNVSAAFIIFGNPKTEKEFESFISNHSSPNHPSERSINSPSTLKMSHSSLHFLPINTDSYAHILGCCDIGILLSGSRYGFDYAPELTELVACGTPTLVGKGGCMSEVVESGKNGFVFESMAQLGEILAGILVQHKADVGAMRRAMEARRSSWEKEWEEAFGPILEELKMKEE